VSSRTFLSSIRSAFSSFCFFCGAGTFLLLPGYCLVNFAFVTCGLYLTKHGGAALSSLSYSVLLPLATLSNALPLLGRFREQLQGTTVVGLVVVLLGFALYEKDELWPLLKAATSQKPCEMGGRASPGFGSAGSKPPGEGAPLLLGSTPSLPSSGSLAAPDSYQERLMLVPLPVRARRIRSPVLRPRSSPRLMPKAMSSPRQALSLPRPTSLTSTPFATRNSPPFVAI
jgi:hypothetical protein